MKKSLILLFAVLLVSPLAALAAESPATTTTVPEAEPGASTPNYFDDELAIGSLPLLDAVGTGAVVQAGCADLTPCSTAADCPCQAPDCACVPISGCRFSHACLCRLYCFGGQQP